MIGKIYATPPVVWNKTPSDDSKNTYSIQSVASSSAKWNAQGATLDLTGDVKRESHSRPAMAENICPRTLMLTHGIDLIGNSTDKKIVSPKLNSQGSPYSSPEIKLGWSERGFAFPTRLSLPRSSTLPTEI